MGSGSSSYDRSGQAAINNSGNTNTVDIILVRHGISCANLRKEAKGRPWHTFVPDPELTYEGTRQAQIRGYFLRKKLEEEYSMPIVGASVLLRAQMTAYLMMYPPIVHMIPYVSETGFGSDNKPDFTTQQKKRDRNPLYVNMNVKQAEPWPEDANTPNWDKFCNFIKNNYNQLQESKQERSNAMKQAMKQSMNMATPLVEYHNQIKRGLNINEKTIKNTSALNVSNIQHIKTTIVNNTVTQQLEKMNPFQRNYFQSLKIKGAPPPAAGGASNRPLVIVSHGHFIESVLKKYGVTITQEQRPNYAAFKFVFDLTSGNIIGTPEVYAYMPTFKSKAKNGINIDIDILSPEINTLKECKLQEATKACSVDPCTSRGSEEIYINDRVTDPKNSLGGASKRRRKTRRARQKKS